MTTRILIADDEPDVRDFLAAVMKGAGYVVDEVANGAEVLTRLAQPAPDLVLMDLQMPTLSGLQALEQIRTVESWKGVPVLFLTASGQTDDMVRARDLGARGYLMKPIRSAELLSRVRLVLEDASLLWLDDITQSRAG